MIAYQLWVLGAKCFARRPVNRGQGVIEYAGALVIAAVIVAGGLAAFPNAFGDVFDMILQSVSDSFTDALPS